MKKHINKAGVKHWYGNHLVDLQTEPLDAIEALLSNYGAFIVSGCEVTPNAGTPANFDIAPGIVAIDHADGFKVARFAGVTNSSTLGYLSIDKTPIAGTYDSGSDDIAEDYTAEFTAGAAPNSSNLYLPITDPLSSIPRTFSAALHRSNIVTSGALNWVSSDVSCSCSIKINRATRQAHIVLTGSLLSLGSWTFDINTLVLIDWSVIQADANIAPYITPAFTKSFTGYVTQNLGTYLGVPPQFNCFYQNGIGILAEMQEAGALYDFSIDATIYLD
ncbi:MAG: hypothetical protein ACK4EY_15060 [Flavipsychrobacter sp.]